MEEVLMLANRRKIKPVQKEEASISPVLELLPRCKGMLERLARSGVDVTDPDFVSNYTRHLEQIENQYKNEGVL
jgi:hypothetical protein